VIGRVWSQGLIGCTRAFLVPKQRTHGVEVQQDWPRNRPNPVSGTDLTSPAVMTKARAEVVTAGPSNIEVAPASLRRLAPTDRGPMSVGCRVQANIVARHERRALDWMCERMPPSVSPDVLTIAGIVGAILALFGYAATAMDPAFVWLATFGIVLHWFGDSLDGSLARYRACERPSYGYYLDHSIDALCNLMIVGGLGLSTFVRLDVALFVLCGYYLLCIHVFLHNHVTGVFRLSFLALGPTELRLGLVSINILFFFGKDAAAPTSFYSLSTYDWFLIAVGCLFVAIFVYQSCATIAMLRKLEPGNDRRR
jgi:archaetidylinositol phosphate synthase